MAIAGMHPRPRPNCQDGDGDRADDDEIDTQEVVDRIPSFAESCITPGLTAHEQNQIIPIEPEWVGTEGSDGSWGRPTRGDGEAEMAGEQDANTVVANCHWGVISA